MIDDQPILQSECYRWLAQQAESSTAADWEINSDRVNAVTATNV